MIFKSSLVLATILAFANGQLFEFGGGCPAVTPMNNFDMGKFHGKWYEILKYPYTPEPPVKCSALTFSAEWFWHKLEYSRTASATNLPITTSCPVVPLIGSSSSFVLIPIYTTYPILVPFQIIDTDYTSYAIAGGCIDFGFAKMKVTWVLSRQASSAADQSFINSMNSKLAAKNMASSNLSKVDHTNCPVGYAVE